MPNPRELPGAKQSRVFGVVYQKKLMEKTKPNNFPCKDCEIIKNCIDLLIALKNLREVDN